MNKTPHMGSTFDDFLEEEGIQAECSAIAIKRVIAWQFRSFMENGAISKSALARKMSTSRTAIDRLLDPTNSSISLITMEKAARVLGKKLEIRLV